MRLAAAHKERSKLGFLPTLAPVVVPWRVETLIRAGCLRGADLWSCLGNTPYPSSASARWSISSGNDFVGHRSDRCGLVHVDSWWLPTIGAALVSGGAWERRRTRAVSPVWRRFTIGRALGSHQRNTERRALVTARTVSGACVTARLGRPARREHHVRAGSGQPWLHRRGDRL